jgi:hypothetical protein
MTVFLHAPRRRRAFFMLTPLVDIMFLLLIFFMLTSETSLYTLMRMSAQAVTRAGGRHRPSAGAAQRRCDADRPGGHGSRTLQGPGR